MGAHLFLVAVIERKFGCIQFRCLLQAPRKCLCLLGVTSYVQDGDCSIHSDTVNQFPFQDRKLIFLVDMMQVENLRDGARVYLKECVTFPESHSLLLLQYVHD
jgi:hypothetical protein